MDHSVRAARKSKASFVNSCELQYTLIIEPLERILRLCILLECVATFVGGSAVTYHHITVMALSGIWAYKSVPLV